MNTPWLEFQALLNCVWTWVQSTGRIWEITDAFGPAAPEAHSVGASSGLTSFIQMLLIGLPRLQLIHQMLRAHSAPNLELSGFTHYFHFWHPRGHA